MRLRRNLAVDPLRIAVVGTRGVPSSYSGVETATEHLYAALAQRGHEVTVYCRQSVASSPNAESYRGIHRMQTPYIRTRSLETLTHVFTSLMHASLRGKFDLVHLQALAPGIFAPFHSAWRVPTVATIHGLDWKRAKWEGTGGSILHAAERAIARHIRDVAVVSRELQAYFMSEYGISTEYLPNGVETAAVDSDCMSRLLSRFGLAPKSYAVCLGRLVPEKRVEHVLQAFGLVQTVDSLVIVGEGSYTASYVSSLKAMAQNDSRIRFVGRLEGNELAAVLRNAAAMVTASELEGLPLAVLEAMQSAVPVVASDIPPHRELLGNVPGYDMFFPVGDVIALADCLARALTRPNMVVARKAQAYVHSEYSWPAIAERTERLFRRAVLRSTPQATLPPLNANAGEEYE